MPIFKAFIPNKNLLTAMLAHPDDNKVRDLFKEHGLPYHMYLNYKALVQSELKESIDLPDFTTFPTTKESFKRHLPSTVRMPIPGIKIPADWPSQNQEPEIKTKWYKRLYYALIRKLPWKKSEKDSRPMFLDF